MPSKTKSTRKPAAIDGKAEVVTAREADLADLSRKIQTECEQIDRHAEAFKDAALPRMLRIGLLCIKARHVFAITDPGARNAKGRNQHTEGDDDTAGSESFSKWLSEDAGGLKKPNAYRYMKASEGLGLDHKSTDTQLQTRLRKIQREAKRDQLPKPSIASLGRIADAGQGRPETKALPDSKQTRLEDAREAVHALENQWHKLTRSGALDDLHKPDLNKLKQFLLTCRDQVNAALK